MNVHPGRRRLLRPATAALPVTAVILFGSSSLPAATDDTDDTAGTDDAAVRAPADESTVRLLAVGAALTDDLFEDVIVADFEAETGYTVEVTQGQQDIMDRARRAEADIVLVHLGFTPLHEFVTDGRGAFPAPIMSNTVVFLAPPGDPAGIKQLDDPFDAFEAIAANESPFVVNNLGETRYITDTVYEAAGRPDPGDWLVDDGLSGPQAVIAASQRGAYTVWGLHPFLNLRDMRNLDLEAVVYNDSLMQRILATTVVQRPPGRVNEEGARALEEFLTDPATQSEIRRLRVELDEGDDHPEITEPIFWPAGNQNDS